MAQNKSLTIGEFIRQCLAKWKWFAISVTATLLLAVVYLIITPPKYTKTAHISKTDSTSITMAGNWMM